ncbi:GNAT family N-acetyltransferase [Phytohalomonas tamaricis]|uniref:GNAT family N-acetyltransferase n=1 Tax=Phytohalomonas tamaricis TaxID=2081032 RepID=UPI000D0BA6DF|nr:GNAT family N-acetyltransferase [Phytohalomonas tamaricis]
MASIRAYQQDDQDRLVEIWLAASRVGHPFLGIDELVAKSGELRHVYLPNAENWVAEHDDEIVGFIGMIAGYIGGLFVDPCWHGCGIGRALVMYAYALKGVLTLEVYSANQGAVAFYTRLGFVVTRRRPRDDQGRPLEVIEMTLTRA